MSTGPIALIARFVSRPTRGAGGAAAGVVGARGTDATFRVTGPSLGIALMGAISTAFGSAVSVVRSPLSVASRPRSRSTRAWQFWTRSWLRRRCARCDQRTRRNELAKRPRTDRRGLSFSPVDHQRTPRR